ncbi:MAG: hypothetical protein KAX18_02645 [Candidatus Lokiarchaeota archaeon]|nr:hypothetical protein [Candidatus Lokiarchaeota archaeon]
MITWIVGGFLSFFIILRRFSQDGKVKGQPLGMPRGTVRALITIMIVAFPFGYLIFGEQIPGLIINTIFIVVAFYFEARRGEKEKLMQIVKELKGPDLTLEEKEEKKPLYLPKYTVRVSLVVMLLAIIFINWLGPDVPFEQTNTLADLILIIGFFIIGAFFRSIAKAREKKDIREQIKDIDASLSDAEIIEKLLLREPSWFKRKGKNILSIIVLIVVITALFCYTFEIDYTLLTLTTLDNYRLTLVGLLLIFTNAYYGFRD